jgi:hypothetical protein
MVVGEIHPIGRRGISPLDGRVPPPSTYPRESDTTPPVGDGVDRSDPQYLGREISLLYTQYIYIYIYIYI